MEGVEYLSDYSAFGIFYHRLTSFKVVAFNNEVLKC